MSLFSSLPSLESCSSLHIPPHYPPSLFSQPQPSVHLETREQKSEQTLKKKTKTTTFVEDTALLLSLHQQRSVSPSSHLEPSEGDEMSLRDLPSGLIRQGLDETVNMMESAREWRDR
jgi:hypothetical protein